MRVGRRHFALFHNADYSVNYFHNETMPFRKSNGKTTPLLALVVVQLPRFMCGFLAIKLYHKASGYSMPCGKEYPLFSFLAVAYCNSPLFSETVTLLTVDKHLQRCHVLRKFGASALRIEEMESPNLIIGIINKG